MSIEANGRVEMDAEGRAVRFPGVLIGLEQRRRIEAERDQANTLLRNFIEAVPGVVFAKDREGRLILGNRGVADLLGVPSEAYVGRTDRELLADARQAEAVMANDRRIMESGVPEQIEEDILLADGSPATWLSTKAPMRDGEGQVVGLVGASLDITDRKRMEDALRQSEQRKDEFLAMLAHELRNPLAPIGTAAELLRLAPGDEVRVNQVAQVILRQVAHMTEIVDDLLDVSRVTRGLVEFEREPVDLRTVIATAVEQVEPVIQARRHALVVESTGEDAIVIGDRHRLVQVVSNLLNNAAKYTPTGGRIEVSLAGSDEEVGIRVSDNGNGMDVQLLPHVFDLFTQAERTPDRGQGGLGIGLALVRSIVQAHAGRVSAYSAGRGQGSTFAVALPRAPAGTVPLSERTSPIRQAVQARVVLLVDDNRDAADTLGTALRLLGHDVSVAASGAEAIAIAAGRTDWDAFILDIGLPDMTGHELVGRLRRSTAGRPARFVALSGYGQLHDERMSREAGFDTHLVKPADIERIESLLATAPPG
jgi:PAS domain S-box-containing protein